MMMLTLVLAAAPIAATPDLLAIRVGRAETVSGETLENAVILVEDGKISTVGEDLLIERGIPVLDRPDWVALPGLVNAYSRLGLSGRGGSDATPHVTPLREIYPHASVYDELPETGVTSLAVYPPGTGIPGQAIVLRPSGDTREEMIVDESAYLKVFFRASSRSKKLIRDGFKKVDDYEEKEKKAREKYEKEKEKAEKAKKKKKSDDDDDKKKDEDKDGKAATPEDDKEKELGPYTPPEPDPEVVPFMDLREGELKALVSISDAADYLHLLDAVGDEEFDWDLRLPVTRELNIYEIADRLGEKGMRIVMEPELSLHPGTLRQRNLPAELARAGVELVLIPRNDSIGDFKSWLRDTGDLVARGLDPATALRAMTLAPAELIGMGERVGSIEKGKDANLIFLSGDPFEPSTRLEAVMLEGEFIHGEVK